MTRYSANLSHDCLPTSLSSISKDQILLLRHQKLCPYTTFQDTNISDEMVSQLKSYRLRWCFLILTFGLIGTCAAHDKKENGTISSGIPSMRNRPPYTFPGSYKAPEAEQVYHCGRFINDSRGFIHTPSFPKRFPVPILCRWVLKRPPGKKIVLYFTQFYMRESFHLTEYDSYTDEQIYRGRHELGTWIALWRWSHIILGLQTVARPRVPSKSTWMNSSES